ncbi:peptidylprolyl isomerase [Saccharomycopsis crataegensis]|uniref:Peptidyl-prolyl cis-trans isomerase n=1 Tax=Saccharomycopsis crataegensis TaxID=43959 RepID=A0AAV5QS01_9ASCO|nr:peptidylprolyl isomerase [Saccharomycopsis crataegensis]
MVATGLPEGWEIRKSKTHNRHYYFNPSTKQSVWDPPEGTNTDQLKEYFSALKEEPTQVRAAHLLVKHNQSRNPSSWKNDNITISKQEAIDILKGYEQRIKSGEVTLTDLAQTESDCSSHKRGGDLGFFTKGQMQPPFEKAAFGLKVGEMSGIVETNSGVHLVQRLG